MYRNRIVITCNTHHILIIIYIRGWGWNAAGPAGTDEEFFFNLIEPLTCSATTQQTGHRTQQHTAQHSSTQFNTARDKSSSCRMPSHAEEICWHEWKLQRLLFPVPFISFDLSYRREA